jgi:voltage-gated potassium channel Kch
MNGEPAFSVHHERPRWQWWVVIVVTPAALIAGTFGFHRYDVEQLGHASWITSLYHAAQMFVLHTPHLEGNTNVPLEVGRWLAAIAFGIAALSALYYVFATEWHLFRLWFARDHVVVCGLGRLGALLAVEFRQAGRRVVAIEASATAAGIQHARNHGIPVLIGDACTSEMLARARAQDARWVLAVCPDDQANVGIAALTGALVAANRRKTALTECWLFITDAKVRATLRREHLFPGGESRYRVNVGGLDLFAVAARQAFQEHPLDHRMVAPGSQTSVHLVLVGFGQMGQALALQAARVGHFANGMGLRDGERLKVTLVDQDIDDRWARFAADYPMYERICEVDRCAWTFDDRDLMKTLVDLLPDSGPLEEVLTFVLCVDTTLQPRRSEVADNPLQGDDTRNLSLALKLAPLVREKGAQVLVQVRERCGIGSLFDAETRNPSLEANLHAFGIIEDLCGRRTLVDEVQDGLAREIHECWRQDRERKRQLGKVVAASPADVPWENLDESYKNSNRQYADHIPAKLRAIGYHIGPLSEKPSADLTANELEVELLARMEHARWCAEKWLDGWSVGETRDNVAKRHPDLRHWDELPVDQRAIDTILVACVPGALKKVGKAAYR